MLILAHLLLISAAFITFALSVVMGLLFLYQEHLLKHHLPIPASLQWIPALEIMEGRHTRVLTVGFILLSLGMFVGAILSKKVFGTFFTADPRAIASLFTWAIYALFLNVRTSAGWRGRRGILLSLLGFLTVLLTFLAAPHGSGLPRGF